jgi:hypothetical protein
MVNKKGVIKLGEDKKKKCCSGKKRKSLIMNFCRDATIEFLLTEVVLDIGEGIKVLLGLGAFFNSNLLKKGTSMMTILVSNCWSTMLKI